MSHTIRHKYKYFHSTVQRAKDRRQKFHFCRLPFDVRPRNVKLNLSNSRQLTPLLHLWKIKFGLKIQRMLGEIIEFFSIKQIKKPRLSSVLL